MALPILQSLLLADHIYRDQSTGKHIICGIFSTIFFTPNLPQSPPLASPSVHDTTPGTLPPAAITQPQGLGSSTIIGGTPGSVPQQVPANPTESLPPVSRTQPIQSLMQAGSPYCYFSVTELKGRKTFEVRYVELQENRVLFQAEVPIDCDDPLKTIEVSLPLPRLPLVALEERVYALEILCEGQLLGSHRVLARITPGSNPPAQ